ncbi:astacin-like metalloprotease toxin 5 [Parasteatoda tepidariorum]|uniref:astacin-like metalloprotease toxin 5 n=1 Tax=Parasteatoda tepidariorum TaxID=114398 RepID=UPI00077FB14E|nr:astacin-like metalloprotease toxin 5 [Parasteatoda tepidariorum]
MKMLFPKIVAIFLSLFCRSFGFPSPHLGNLPLENPDLLGGDILGIPDFDRSATVHPEYLWPNGVVPYVEDPSLRETVFFLRLEGAIEQYEKNTCIRFIKRTTEKDYLRLFPGEGCYSHVGRTGGAQPLSLGHGCGFTATIVHELGHAIGFFHEQNRSDRDDYLVIYWKNIKEGLEDQFFKLKPEENQLLTEFDYDSIMLYGSYTFSKDRKNLKTMEGKGGRLLPEVVVKYNLSKTDIKRINMLYKCK